HIAGLYSLAVMLFACDPQPDDEIRRGTGTDGFGNLAQEAQAVFHAAAILVFPAVHMRVEKLRGQVAMAGVALAPVKAGLHQPKGRVAITADNLLDHSFRE